jgi:cell division protein ZapA (FtsZ GTPase activity inhibitor)
MKRKVDVTLLGRRFTVKTEKDDSHVHALASQVSRRLDDVRRQVRGASVEEAALLVAMQLADEMADERTVAAELRREIRARTESMVQKLRAALGATDGHAVDREDDSDVIELAVSRQA